MSAIPTITMQKVESSQFAAIGHVPELSLLAIQFHPKKSTGESDTYHYQNVSAEMFAEFLGAESQGSFFIQRIKKFPDLFPYAKTGANALVSVAYVTAEQHSAQLARDHAHALDINERCYGKPLPGGQRYSRNTFKANGDPILLDSDGKRSVFCDLCDDVEDAA